MPFSAAASAKMSGSRWPETTMPPHRKASPKSSAATLFIARIPAPPGSSSVPSTSKSTSGSTGSLTPPVYHSDRPHPFNAGAVLDSLLRRSPSERIRDPRMRLPADRSDVADRERRPSRDSHRQRSRALAPVLFGADAAARLSRALGDRGSAGDRLVRGRWQLLDQARRS